MALRSPWLCLLLLPLLGCPTSGGDDDDSTYPDVETYDFEAAEPWFECPDLDDFPDEVTIATVFDEAEQDFGDPNRRDIQAEVELPTGDWKQVGLWFELECPEGSGGCDDWDRAGSLQVAVDPAAPADQREWAEVARHVTPYNRGMCQYIDVTQMASMLQGPSLFNSHIDTWVAPGWLVTAKLVYTPGEPRDTEVINIWGHRTITVGNTDPSANVDSQVDPVTVAIPADATRVRAHLITTGHGFGHSGNCAEFCGMQHDIHVGGDIHSWGGWRDDCDQNPVSPQQGTWEYGRNGWCPGAMAVGKVMNIFDSVTPGEDATLDFDILLANGLEYDNTQPGGDGSPFTRVSLKLYIEK